MQHNAPGGKITGYVITSDGLTFLWNVQPVKNAILLPFKMDSTAAVDFAQRWLEEQEPQEPSPLHDGHNGKGWRCYAVEGLSYAVCTVQPVWALYGK